MGIYGGVILCKPQTLAEGQQFSLFNADIYFVFELVPQPNYFSVTMRPHDP